LETERIQKQSKEQENALKKIISQSIISRLTSKKGYEVKGKDILSIINEITEK